MFPSSGATHTPAWARHGLIALLVAAAYLVVGKLTFLIPVASVPNDMISIVVWPASAIAFVGYWRFGWPGLLGAFLGTLLLHYSFNWSMSALKLTTAVANILPPLLARWLLLRTGTLDPFGSTRGVLHYTVLAGLVAPLANTLVSMLALWLFLHKPLHQLWATGLIWWAADAFAMLLVTPALMTWRDWTTLNYQRWLELILLVIAILAVFHELFMGSSWPWAAPLSLLLLPPIYAALFRFNLGVMAGISLLISLLGVVATSTDYSNVPGRNQYFYLLGFLAMQAIFYILMCSGLASTRRTLNRLTSSEERFRAMFEQAAVGIVVHDFHTNQHTVNRKLADMLGYSEAELLHMKQSDLIVPSDLALAEQQTALLIAGERDSAYQEIRYQHRDGSVLWLGMTVSLMRSQLNNADFVIALFQDISARKTAEADVERLALYDHLTALPNRRLFGDRLLKALSSARRSGSFGALIYVDLDNFKNLNDAHGHSIGDEMLVQVAERLQATLREEDTVARLGGDEFVALLQNLSATLDAATDAVWSISRKILQSFSEPFALSSGIEFFVTASIGVTLFPKGNETAEDLLKEADIAMYRVKEDQRNAIRFYAPEMKAEANFRAALERDLRLALQREEFELYVQPQHDAARNAVGCEVLLRWPDAQGNMIPPNTFIPIAEETGLIVPLGEWVLRRAAQLIRRLALAGEEIAISVNVSPRQFQEANFVESVRDILWETGADADRLILEITEGLVMADFDDARAKLSQLKTLGVRLSIDDFGTGHSSLAYLKRLPLHELKIDRTFIKDLPHDSNDAALVEAILAMSRHLQLDVVAEGVETAEQYAFLKQRGCNRFQGYHFGRPQPVDDYFAYLDHAPITQSPVA